MRREADLAGLRRLAEEMAKGRGEKVSTGHLLAAVASAEGPASELLLERRLNAEVLLKAARVATDDEHGATGRAMERARDFAARSPAREPGALHLLFALCQERTTAAHRIIEQCGTDVAKLRAAAMQQALGLVGARRSPSPQRTPPRVSGPLRPSPALKVSPLKATPLKPPTLPKAPVAKSPPPMVTPALPKAQTVRSPVPATPHRRRNGHMARSVPRALAPTPAPSRFSLDPKAFPLLTTLGKNLTEAAERGELDPVVGRDEEIERTLDVLAKRQANNPCLVGAAGVGKTSVVRGLAVRIAAGKATSRLDDRILLEIEPSALLAGTGLRGALAERIAGLRAEVSRGGGRIVLFFDEVHTLFAPEAGDEAQAELKVALAQGELPCIGATTAMEYRRFIDSDPALSRRFTPIEVVELSVEESLLALEGVAPAFERHHGTRYAKEALAASVAMSARYLPDKALPDKAVSILDLAGARGRRRDVTEITPEHIADVVSELAQVPRERLLQTDGERMLQLESLLASRIVGHGPSLARIAAVLRRNASGLRARRPIGTFLLLGPTGVGKTETAKALAECLFHSSQAMTRLDLSEYAEAHAVARLVGAPPGYVGHEAGGQLTEAVRRRPYQVVLLDEMEKAHRDVLEAFLQVFDEGRLTDGRGRTIDFTNAVLLLTSNLGSDVAVPNSGRGPIGFSGARAGAAAAAADYQAQVIAAARGALPPELYNRLDEVLVFAPLTRDDVAEVARRLLRALGDELLEMRGVRLDVAEAAIEALLDAGGFEPALGARPVRRTLARLVEAPLAELLLRGDLRGGDVATVDVEDGQVVVDAVSPRRYDRGGSAMALR